MSDQFQVIIIDDPQNLVVEINSAVSPDIEVTVAPDPTALVVALDNGIVGPQGPQGQPGTQGAPGVGVPSGGLTGQILVKASNTNYDTQWITDPAANAITGLSGDVIATGPGTAVANLSPTGVSAGSYLIANVTVDNKGRITAASDGFVQSIVNAIIFG